MRLTIADFDARAEALEECSAHLDLNWTDKTTEIVAGQWLARKLDGEAAKWRIKAMSARNKQQRIARAATPKGGA